MTATERAIAAPWRIMKLEPTAITLFRPSMHVGGCISITADGAGGKVGIGRPCRPGAGCRVAAGQPKRQDRVRTAST